MLEVNVIISLGKKFFFLALTLFLGVVSTTAQEIPQGYSLYTDKKAKQQEDIITVLIVEDAKAKNDTRTETDVEQGLGFRVAPGNGTIAKYIPGLNMGFDHDARYDGRGKTSRSGSVKAKVSARIITVYENGNLLIDGHKEVQINDETELIHVTGIIRPDDVMHDNTIYSYKIADAKIEYMGKGVTQDAQKPGVLTRFFNWLF